MSAPRPPHRTPIAAAVLAAAALSAVGLFHVWTRTRVLALGYEMARLEGEHRHLAAERERLELEVTTLRAPGRLERFARTRLGMAPPAPGAVVAGGTGGGVWGEVAAADLGDRRSGPAEPASSAARVALGATRRR